ncbi:MAG TPA: hypothetical protein VGS07_11080 [Thermoanaerobaculia bacterium]|nr:hypothetical protein [Thermoanaerobaculia bacterium]
MSQDVRDALAGPAALDSFLRLPSAVYRGDPFYNATPRGMSWPP